MRKILLILALLFSLLATAVLAQETDVVDKARQDYLFQYSNYSQLHSTYVTTKESYGRFGTLKSREEAIAATKQVLVARAESYRTYLQLLKVMLNQRVSMDASLRSAQFGKIEATQQFLETHKSNIERAQSIPEVNEESSRFEREIEAMTSLAHETRAVLLIGRLQEFEARASALTTDLENSPDLPTTQPVSQSLGELRNKLSEVRLTIDQALVNLDQYQRRRRGQAEEILGEIQSNVASGKQTLQEAIFIIQELQEAIDAE